MRITALAARWPLTAACAAAGLGAAPTRRGRGGAGGRGEPASCLALGSLAMTWRSEPAAATSVRAAVFRSAALWPELEVLLRARDVRKR
jgi:hypothetical protein